MLVVIKNFQNLMLAVLVLLKRKMLCETGTWGSSFQCVFNISLTTRTSSIFKQNIDC